MQKDCSFQSKNKRFRYRAAAIIVENDCVLFAGNEINDYYYSIGGGVHIGETAEEAVQREVFEETGIHYEIEHLAIIHENFFVESTGKYQGLDSHEIAFYFLMKSRGTQKLMSNSFTQGVKENMHWIAIEDLDKVVAYPVFMKSYLQSKHKEILHIVTDERL